MAVTFLTRDARRRALRRLGLVVRSPRAQMMGAVLACALVVITLGLSTVDSVPFQLTATTRWVEIDLEASRSAYTNQAGGDFCWDQLSELGLDAVTRMTVPQSVANAAPFADWRPGDWFEVTVHPPGRLGVGAGTIPRPATVRVRSVASATPGGLSATSAATRLELRTPQGMRLRFNFTGIAQFLGPREALGPIDFGQAILHGVAEVPPTTGMRYRVADAADSTDVFCHGKLTGVRGLRFGRLVPAPAASAIIQGKLDLPNRSDADDPSLNDGDWLLVGRVAGELKQLQATRDGAFELAFAGETHELKLGRTLSSLENQMPTQLARIVYDPTWTLIAAALVPLVGWAVAFVRWWRST